MKLTEFQVKGIHDCVVYGCYQAIEPNSSFEEAMNHYTGYVEKFKGKKKEPSACTFNLFCCIVDKTVANIIQFADGTIVPE